MFMKAKVYLFNLWICSEKISANIINGKCDCYFVISLPVLYILHYRKDDLSTKI